MPIEEVKVGEITVKRVNTEEYTYGPYDPVRCSACGEEAVVSLSRPGSKQTDWEVIDCMSLCNQCADELSGMLELICNNT